MYNFFHSVLVGFSLLISFGLVFIAIVARANHGVERDKTLDINKLDWIFMIQICIDNLSHARNIFNHITTTFV